MVLASLHHRLHVSPNFFVPKTHLQLMTGISADITPRMDLSLSTIVGRRTSPPFSSTCFLKFSPYNRVLTILPHSYASALQAMALFGLDFGRFPAVIGTITFLAVSVFHTFRGAWKLTKTLSVRVPCSFLSITFMLETPSTFPFSKPSCSTFTTPEKT